jgi:lipoyl(octanoyl) transferase
MNDPRDPQPRQEIQVCHLGLRAYGEGIEIQEALRERRLAGEIPDTLLLLEHPPTYTRGRRSAAEELPFPESFYEARGAEVHTTDRGGRITYHGPGQLVGYPIMAVGDVHRHLRLIEEAIIDALSQAGVEAHSRREEGSDYTGVWVGAPQQGTAGERKIASLGVHISRGISTHGFAVNVENDLEPFSWVIACGLPDVTMTSLAVETDGAGEGLGCFRKRMAFSFARAHGRRQRLVSPARLGIAPRDPTPADPGRPHENHVGEPMPAYAMAVHR